MSFPGLAHKTFQEAWLSGPLPSLLAEAEEPTDLEGCLPQDGRNLGARAAAGRGALSRRSGTPIVDFTPARSKYL